MVGKVSERVLLREGEHPRWPDEVLGVRRLTRTDLDRTGEDGQWHEADELAGGDTNQPEKLLYVSLLLLCPSPIADCLR